jgi:hypothetical protein
MAGRDNGAGEGEIRMLRIQRCRLLPSVLTLAALALTLVAAPNRAAAAPVPSQGATAEVEAAGAAAERMLLQAQLTGYGLTERAAADRVALLTDEEVHAIVADPDALRVVAGSTGETVAAAAVVLLLLYGMWFMFTNG